jgi:hypothetical protein
MKRLRIIFAVFVLFGLFGFDVKKDSLIIKQEVPADFAFVVNDGRCDSYNSQNNSFSRKYLDEEKIIRLEFTKEEKEKIYSFVTKINFFEMPLEFEPNGIIKISNPSFKQIIVVFSNGKKKFVSYNTGYTNDLNDKKARYFLDLYRMIWDVLYKKEEIIKMPESDIHYK